MISNSQTAHNFAHNVKENLHSGSMFWESRNDGTRRIYSYGHHFCIAIIDPAADVVLFTTRGYSNTTSKHILEVRCALYQNNIIRVYDPEAPAPNKVGTITDAKLNEWITWLNKRRGVAQAVCNERREGVLAFMARLNQMDPTQFDKFKVSPNGGEIVKNGLEFTYKVEEDGNIRQSIKVHYSAGWDLDTFLKMIAGTFTTSEKIY